MHSRRETFAPINKAELSQQDIDGMFERMSELYEVQKELTDSFGPKERKLELEAIRDGILAELMEHNPHEALFEVVHSLTLLYEGRTVVKEYDDRTVTSFATRDETNQRLDDHFDIIQHASGDVSLYASFLPFSNTGHAVYVRGKEVRTYTLALPTYRIPTYERDGSLNPSSEILRDFYLRTLSTAGFVLNRRQNDPEAADAADSAAKAMIIADHAGERTVSHI